MLVVIGKAKLVLRNLQGKKVKSMALVVQDEKECLLGKRDGDALGLIVIVLQGAIPGGSPK